MPDLSSLRLPVLVLTLTLGACTDTARFPSLAQRPAEAAYAATTPATPAPQPPGHADSAILHQIAALSADAVRAHDSFSHSADEADRLATAARGAPTGSEAWATATTALGALDAARSATRQTLADLDALRGKTAISSAEANTPSSHATYADVTDADNAVAGMLAEEDARIAALHKVIGD